MTRLTKSGSRCVVRALKYTRGLVIAGMGIGGMGILCASATWADADKSLVGNQVEPLETKADNKAYGIKNGSVVVVPIPFANPLIGTGLTLGAGYLFQADSGSKTSVIGFGAMRSDNGSEAAGASVDLSFANGTWKFSTVLAKADLKYDLISQAGNIPIRQAGDFAKIQLSHQVAPAFLLGVVAKRLSTQISAGGGGLGGLGTSYALSGGLETYSYGIIADWDLRDSDLFARTGSRLLLTGLHNETSSAQIGEYQKFTALYNWYHPIGEQNVFAMRFAGCDTERLAPYYDLCSIGGTDGMRGFNPTVFLDSKLLSVQGEYRHRFSKRMGMVAFAGAGAVGGSFDALDRNGAAAGVGLRVGVSKKFPVNLAIDASYNSHDEALLYISVGERF